MHHLVIYGRLAPTLAELVRSLGFGGTITTATTPDAARTCFPEADILLTGRLPAELASLLSRCRWVQSVNAGIEDLASAPFPSGVTATRVVGVFGGYIAEYVLGYVLAHLLRMRENTELQRQRKWQHYYTGRLEGKLLGLAGLGNIGSEVARRAGALGLRLRGLSRTGAPVPGMEQVFPASHMAGFCRGLDFLAITLPLTPETDGLVGREALDALNPGALVINCGRGRVLQESAVLEAMRSGHLGGAVLDVFATEPLPPEHPYWTEPGIIVTPHVAGPSVPADMAAYFMENYARFCAGEELKGIIDRTRGY